MMTVLVIQPGFPAEIPYFTRGLAQMGARVLGIGDQPVGQLPDVAREGLSAYLRVDKLWDSEAVIDAVRRWEIPGKLDRIECLWEPGMLLAAKLREAYDLPGMPVKQTILFRDKDLMKEALDRAGIRTPKHRRARNHAEIAGAARQIGFPIIIKPIAGAGSADTYHLRDQAALDAVLPRVAKVAEFSVEEYIEGREYTFDTICADGRILYFNMAVYRPNVLIGRSEEWVSPQTVTLRDVNSPELVRGRRMGEAVIKALGFQTGFTHMEWFLKPNGEAVFGEIAARPPGGRSVELMNYGCDMDAFTAWAEVVLDGKLSQNIERKYNAAVIFKRARGSGRIQRIEGLQRILGRFGQHIMVNQISPIGAPRRDWKQTLVSDGYIILRHPDLDQTLAMADAVAGELHLFAAE